LALEALEASAGLMASLDLILFSTLSLLMVVDLVQQRLIAVGLVDLVAAAGRSVATGAQVQLTKVLQEEAATAITVAAAAAQVLLDKTLVVLRLGPEGMASVRLLQEAL
jgi:hypothetical protein